VLPHVMADMAARIAKGADQYGDPLTTENGRDALQDAYEEALDLAMYLKQALMERAIRSDVIQRFPNGYFATSEKASPVSWSGQVPEAEKDWREWANTRYSEILAQTKPQPALVTYEPWPGPNWSQAPDWAMWWCVSPIHW